MSMSSASIMVQETCKGIKRLSSPLIFQRPTLHRMKQISIKFESLHRILYILGARDGIIGRHGGLSLQILGI